MENKRSIDNIPEGGCLIHHLPLFKVIDALDAGKKLGEGVTREWIIKYSNTNNGNEMHEKMPTFLVHADTKEGAFEHFCSLFPDTFVKRLEYY